MGLGNSIGADLAAMGYYGQVYGISPGIGAAPVHHAMVPVHHQHPAAHPHAGVPALPYPPALAHRMFNPAPGAPSHQAVLRPLPLLAGAYVAAGVNPQAINVTPRHQFQGRRLTYTETRTAGATGLVSIDAFAIGGNLQFEGAGAIGAQTFAFNAYDTDMKLTPCSPGVFITGSSIISTLPAGADRVDFTWTLSGEALV